MRDDIMKAFFFLSEWVIDLTVKIALWLILLLDVLAIVKQIHWRDEL